jgi:formylglycine-generating enzyme required for sulfatase activity
MMDIFTPYERGLEELLKRLGKDHPRYAEVLILQSRLLENIALARCYGDTETRRAERAQILDILNSVSMDSLHVSFNEFTAFGKSTESREDSNKPSEDFLPIMTVIPSGKFVMGSGSYDPWASDNEMPQHTFFLDSYYIGKYPITNFQYDTFLRTTGYQGPKGWCIDESEPFVPVTQVSWHDCWEYCRWLKKITERNFRLPTEAEWEKAARGKDGRRWPWGNEFDEAKCNITTELSAKGITPVGKFSPIGDSSYGISDMAGNVWEWTSSLIRSYPYRHDERENLDIVGDRVLRGGSWFSTARSVRCSYRSSAAQTSSRNDIGFRVVYSGR